MNESDVLDLVRENEEAVEVEKTIEGELCEEETVTEPEASNIEDTPTKTTEAKEDTIDYESLMREDLAELKREFSELGDIDSITELSNPLRYAALRDLGLSPKEAYMATTPRKPPVDNRSHLSSAVGRSASRPAISIPPAQLRMARELFRDMSDAEINALYRRVTK